jgi:UDP-N-acetyl-D-mannosaminuronic acid dehydrogenase
MHLPGAGVGGHCIPKDPWLLAYAADDRFPLRLIPTARAINDEMPDHVADLVVRALEAEKRPVFGARVGVLGYAYLENSDDTRNSPTVTLISRLEALGMMTVVHDPWVADYQGDLLSTINNCDVIVLMVKHDAYRQLDLSALKTVLRAPILVDGRGFYNPSEIRNAGFSYSCVGRG